MAFGFFTSPHFDKIIKREAQNMRNIMEATTGTPTPNFPTFTDRLEYLETLASGVAAAADAAESLAFKTFGYSGGGTAKLDEATQPKPGPSIIRLADAAGQIDFHLGRLSAVLNAMNARA